MNLSSLTTRLQDKKNGNLFRELTVSGGFVDFCSNDYLGIVRNRLLEMDTNERSGLAHGSTGSRLLSGNYPLIEETERLIADFHNAAEGLLFNSGYDANIGLLSCIAEKQDTILYDLLSHASIRDGIRLSRAKSFHFPHNDMESLGKKLQQATGNIYVVTESVFSMDGDKAPLQEMISICERYQANLIIDEAHAGGVIGNRGEGLVQELGLENKCFARVHTFGKAVGAHGAIVLGSRVLKDYLINFSRPFIFTTALPETAVQAIKRSYEIFPGMEKERAHLASLIEMFQKGPIGYATLKSSTPIQGVIVEGNTAVKQLAKKLQDHQLDVRPILYPTVARGSERLRIILHSFNSFQEVQKLIELLK